MFTRVVLVSQPRPVINQGFFAASINKILYIKFLIRHRQNQKFSFICSSLRSTAMGKGAKMEGETRTDFFWDEKPEPHALRKTQVHEAQSRRVK
jgi:hypothetical protein